MQFKDFLLLEQDPAGGPPLMGGASPMGPPGMDMGAPPMGGGMDMTNPMGGMGMGGMGGMPPGGQAPEPPPVPQYADVWDVLDTILNHKPLENEQKQKDAKSHKSPSNNPSLVS